MFESESSVVLKTVGLCHSFGRVCAVDQLDMTVRRGEIYGFLGRNGAGKTTTIRILMGIVRPTRGTIELFGKHVRRTSIAQKKRIGYVSQGQFFYPWMTCRVLGRFVAGFYPTWDRAEFDRLLRVLDVPADRKVSQLSGGMRVKLALALALAPRPEMLILDEPTSGLDPVARREFLDMIGRQARAHYRTTLFSSHLVDEVERVADRVGIIHKGRMRYEGDIQTLRDSVRRVRLDPEPLTPVMLQPAEGASNFTAALAVTPAEPVMLDPVEPTLSLGEGQSGWDRFPRSRLLPLVANGTFRILKEEAADGVPSAILAAVPRAWQEHPFPPEYVSGLSLEDIFIAIAGESIGEL